MVQTSGTKIWTSGSDEQDGNEAPLAKTKALNPENNPSLCDWLELRPSCAGHFNESNRKVVCPQTTRATSQVPVASKASGINQGIRLKFPVQAKFSKGKGSSLSVWSLMGKEGGFKRKGTSEAVDHAGSNLGLAFACKKTHYIFVQRTEEKLS